MSIYPITFQNSFQRQTLAKRDHVVVPKIFLHETVFSFKVHLIIFEFNTPQINTIKKHMLKFEVY